MTWADVQDYLKLWWPYLGSIAAMVAVAMASAKSREREFDQVSPTEYAKLRDAALDRMMRLAELLHGLPAGTLEADEVGRHLSCLKDIETHLQATPSESEALLLPQDLLRVKEQSVVALVREIAAIEDAVQRQAT